MRILMLGWEFPPAISGGLGVACHGLTRALDRQGHDVIFVLPKAGQAQISTRGPAAGQERRSGEFRNVTFRETQAAAVGAYGPAPATLDGEERARRILLGEEPERTLFEKSPGAEASPTLVPYTGDMIQAAARYAQDVLQLVDDEQFDLVHAHDWMTFPAAIAIARHAKRPLVVHVHSTEFDRAGEHVNPAICDIERRGLFAADRIIAVSELTRSVCVRQYGVNPTQIDIIYNGIDRGELQPRPGAQIASGDKIVLFLGRITHQKGPEHFLAAAKLVLQKLPNVTFVLAGSGDLAADMIQLAAEHGLDHKVLFTGFLRGRDVERIYSLADCYVMPSTSEPFGIAALEAIHHGIPVILSRQSGAAEVLGHVLKVDFWDTQDLADKILAVLRHPALGQTLREHAPLELRWLTWEAAAEKCLATYRRAAAAHAAPVAAR